MYSFSDQPGAFGQLTQRSQEVLTQLFSRFALSGIERTVPAQTDLCSHAASRDKLYRIKEGVLTCRSQGRALFVYEAGDVAGFFPWYKPEILSLTTDFAIIAEEFERSAFEHALKDSPDAVQLWNEYLSCQYNSVLVMLGTLSAKDVDFAPEVKSLSAGEVVIRQGEHSTEVYTLIEGALDVSVDGVKVGEVLQDEIFGALAAAADTARTATVTARVRSMVISVPREKFLAMIQSRPATTLKLIQDMARTIVSLNQKVVSLS